MKQQISVKKKILLSILLLSLAGNLILSCKLMQYSVIVIYQPQANSRLTYLDIHKVREAHEISTGAGVKVGILDWGFGFSDHPDLYAGEKNFTNNDFLLKSSEVDELSLRTEMLEKKQNEILSAQQKETEKKSSCGGCA